jgi:hypothetical protein
MAVEKWRPYLQRQEFLIRTDHKSLAYLNEQTLHSELQRKAMTRLMGFQFKIIYRNGRKNSTTDALSRIHPLMQVQALSKVKHVWLQEVINAYATDSVAQELLAQLAITSPNDQGTLFSMASSGMVHRFGYQTTLH